jgi:hypothetical protein
MSKIRLPILTSLLFMAVAAHGGLYWFQNYFQRRDFSPIAAPRVRVGYCMAASLAPNEKIEFANSIARPPDRALFASVMAVALIGEVTPEKLSASRALLERDELRSRSVRTLNRVAEKCGYFDAKNGVPEPAEELALKWLEHDPAFIAVLEEARRRPPDAAARMSVVVQQAARTAQMSATAREGAGARSP